MSARRVRPMRALARRAEPAASDRAALPLLRLRLSPQRARRELAAVLERARLEAPGDGLDLAAGADGADGATHADAAADAANGHDAAADDAAALAPVTAALEAVGAPYLVVPPGPQAGCRVAVPRRFRWRSRLALRRRGEAGPAVEFWPLEPGLPERLWRWRWRPAGDEAPPAGDGDAAAARAPSNGSAPPTRGPATVAHVEIGERRYPTVRTMGCEPRVDEVTFPVDVVYTWVDGTDPHWAARKEAARREAAPETAPDDADDPSRYHSHHELRYSLRSVAMFADFVRHVFVVTDGQVPPWLDAAHPDVTVVDHRDIFPAGAHLPTFNSHAIESRLHHIDGLAEHYLYLNDDFFFARPVTPEHFFHPHGATRFFPSKATIPEGAQDASRSVDVAARNTRAVIRERFGRVVEHKIKHAPYPQRRSVLFEMEQVLGEEFARTAANRFRSPDDVAVPSSLAHYYGYLTGRAVPDRLSSRYVSLGAGDLARRLRKLRRGDFDVLCVNDSADAHNGDLARRRRLLARFMEASWPTPSPFER